MLLRREGIAEHKSPIFLMIGSGHGLIVCAPPVPYEFAIPYRMQTDAPPPLYIHELQDFFLADNEQIGDPVLDEAESAMLYASFIQTAQQTTAIPLHHPVAHRKSKAA